MTLRILAKVLINVWSYDLYDMTVIHWKTTTSYDKDYLKRPVRIQGPGIDSIKFKSTTQTSDEKRQDSIKHHNINNTHQELDD